MKQREMDFPSNKSLVIEAIRQGGKFLAGWSPLSTFSTSGSPNKEVKVALIRHLKTGLSIKVEWGFEIPDATSKRTGWKISIKTQVFGRVPQVVYYCFEAPMPSELHDTMLIESPPAPALQTRDTRRCQ